MTVEYKQAARLDIETTQKYIADVLKNKEAAKKFVVSILQAGSLLADNPYMGTLLSSKYDVSLETRFIVVQMHLMFYDVGENTVSIISVIDGRRDYMSLLF